MTRETEVEQYLIKRVRELGGKQAKHVSPGDNGEPDRLIKLRGCPAALLELKRPRKAPTDLQLVKIGEWLEVGMLAGWADSKPMVEAFLRRILNQGVQST